MLRRSSPIAKAGIRKDSIAGRARASCRTSRASTSTYEVPAAAEITIDTATVSADVACEVIVSYLREHHYL
jgi:hypothetical protein